MWIILHSVTPDWLGYIRRLRAAQCCLQSAGSCTREILPNVDTHAETHKYWDMTDVLTSDNGFLLKDSRIIIPLSLSKSFPYDPPNKHTCIRNANLLPDHSSDGLALTEV